MRQSYNLSFHEGKTKMSQRQTLTQPELDAMVAAMKALDVGEDEFDEEDDGQPTEYDEWQDYMGGDDWDQGQYDAEIDF